MKKEKQDALVKEIQRLTMDMKRSLAADLYNLPSDSKAKPSSGLSEAIDALRYSTRSESRLDAKELKPECPEFMQMLRDS